MPPFRMHEVRELIRLIGESDIEEFELDNEGAKIVIRKGVGKQGQPNPVVPASVEFRSTIEEPAAAQPNSDLEKEVPEEKEEQGLHKIVSPMVGTFYRASSPDADPYVQEGAVVEKNSVVCIIEAMKLMNEIEAEVKGVITKVLVENGELVEYGQPLFLVKTS